MFTQQGAVQPSAILGAYELNLDQQLLFKDGDEVAAEPKVVELLTFLYMHRERYVSIEELHNEVWRGKIVSDTAVRSTVKKLRTALGDTDLANPLYVKSMPKRGYRLICDVSFPSADPLVDNIDDKEDDTQHAATAHGEMIEIEPKKYFFPLFLLVFLMLMAWLWQDYRSQVSSTDFSQSSEISVDIISTFPGEKLMATASSDGRLIAFTGRSTIEQRMQVYLFDRHTQEVRQLTTDADNAFDVLFVDGDKGLVYSDAKRGNSSLHYLSLDVPNQTETLLTDVYTILSLNQGATDQELLVNIGMAPGAPLMFYHFDFTVVYMQKLYDD